MMSSLLFATSNAGKIEELHGALSPLGISCLSPGDLGVNQLVVEEDGETYYENALKKAVAYHQATGESVLADDSGLEVDALKGAPGVRSARLGGEEITWPQRWAFLHDLLAVAPQPWTARFRCVLCLYQPGSVPYFFEGICEGKILPEPLGRGGFGYDPVFHSTELNKGFGESTLKEKQSVSHRGRAISFLTTFLSE